MPLHWRGGAEAVFAQDDKSLRLQLVLVQSVTDT